MADNNSIVASFDEAAGTDETGDVQIVLQKSTTALGTTLTAHLAGKLDSSSCVSFSKRMQKALDAGFTNIVLELASLDYLSSAGVGALAALLKKAAEAGGHLALLNVNDTIKELLNVLDMEQFFEIKTGGVQGAAGQSTGVMSAAGQPPNGDVLAGQSQTAGGAQPKAGAPSVGSAAADGGGTVAAGMQPVAGAAGVSAPAMFPLVIKCAACGKALKVPKAGRYRCSGCKAIIKVAESGQVSLG